MSSMSSSAVAAEAGVDQEHIDLLQEIGVLVPDANGHFPAGSPQRVRIVQMLEAAGLPLDGLGVAISRGLVSLDFVDTTSNNRWGSFTDTTFQELSDDTGVPFELLAVIREAMGFPPPQASDRVLEHELEVVPLVRMQHEHGFRSSVVDRALRSTPRACVVSPRPSRIGGRAK